MLIHPLLEKLKTLKLYGMLKALEQQLQMPIQDLSFEERFGLILDQEASLRENRGLSNRLKKALLRFDACFEDIDYRPSRGLDKNLMCQLATGDWITKHHNLILTGATGTGKSYLACAIAHKACLLKFTVLFTKLSQLLDKMSIARADGSYAKHMRTLSKFNLLVLDDWGAFTLNDTMRRDLLEILDDRYNRYSTIVTTQFPIQHLHEFIGDATIADAIMDRLIHNAYKVTLEGESMRKIYASKENMDNTLPT